MCVGAAGLDYQKKYMMRTVTKIIQFFNIMSVWRGGAVKDKTLSKDLTLDTKLTLILS